MSKSGIYPAAAFWSRREFLSLAASATLIGPAAERRARSSATSGTALESNPNLATDHEHRQFKRSVIDRVALVARHNPVLHGIDPLSPLSLGNGEFAFTADITGLQTFPGMYENAMPLCTMSQWGWHTTPAGGLDPNALKLVEY